MTTKRRLGAGFRLLMAAILACAAAAPASATTLRRMDFNELVGRSDRVVHGRVVENVVYWDASRTQIHTDTVIEVLDEAKGSGPGRITVTYLGGELDGLLMHQEGTPTFVKGEEAVLFTVPRPDGKRVVVGFTQGLMRVSSDSETGDRFVTTVVPSGVTFMDRDESGQLRSVRPARMRARLGDLMDQVRDAVTSGEAAGPRLTSRAQPAPRNMPVVTPPAKEDRP